MRHLSRSRGDAGALCLYFGVLPSDSIPLQTIFALLGGGSVYARQREIRPPGELFARFRAGKPAPQTRLIQLVTIILPKSLFGLQPVGSPNPSFGFGRTKLS